MISCIAVDDEPLALDLLEKYCSQIDYLDLKRKFTKTSEAALFLKKFPVDLLFLDIQMPDISGIDFYKSLNDKVMVIFTTAYSEYAVEGFNLSATDYLLKPIKFSRFEQAVKKTKDYLDYLKNSHTDNQRFLYVRSSYRLCRIDISEITYIAGLDNYVKIYTENSKPVITHISMKEMSEKLPKSIFLRVHRSYIVNLSKHISYSNRFIYSGTIKIPIGVSFEKEVHKHFKPH